MKFVRIIILILHLGVFFLLLGTLLNDYIPPKVFPWVNLLSLGFPILISIYALFVLFWIVSWKKRAFVFIVLGLFFINPVKRWVNYSSTKIETPNLKILTLNIKGGKLGTKNIEDFVNQQNADIVLFQEDDHLELNLKNLDKNKVLTPISLYTHYPIKENKILLSGNYADENAYIVQTDLEISGKIYRIINTYLQPFKFEKDLVKIEGDRSQDEKTFRYVLRKLIPNFKVHQSQAEIIAKAVEDSPYPVFVAGDFNSVPNSYEYYHVANVVKDAFLEVGKGSGTSFHDYRFPIRIDYIFSSKSIEPIQYNVDRSVKISDHFPVIATFKIN